MEYAHLKQYRYYHIYSLSLKSFPWISFGNNKVACLGSLELARGLSMLSIIFKFAVIYLKQISEF